MSKTLVIAEKPSVATDLSRVLARIEGGEKFSKKGKDRNTYFENEHMVITSAVGHLVELKMPTGPNGKNLPWKFDVLPAIPEHFELQPIEKTESRLKQVLKLCKRKDVTSIVNACDAGREGELIFKYILEIGHIDKPVKRLWMQSMTNAAILDAWGKLREDKQMVNLTAAAKCRSESDWLVGLNSTRALTCFRSRHGGFNITAAGRVQTPTLAILAKRELEIRAFVSTPYAEVHATFDVTNGQYEGKWIDPDFKKSEEQPHGRPERIWNQVDADTIRDRCEGKEGVVSEKKKPSSQASPQLYDLTTLQREASGRYGFSARRTLQLAQALYERHKMLTYPRTDSRYLPEDYIGQVKKTTQAIADKYDKLADYASKSLKEGLIKGSKRVFNNAKISDHFAIIPTGHLVKLNEDEQKLYDLVTRRFIAVFYPSAKFENTKRLTTIGHSADLNDVFRTDGRILVEPGWLAVYDRKPGVAAGKDELVAVNEGEKAETSDVLVKQDETRPPARYSEATLLSAMEGAGKLVEDEELREAMAERGLGTPATRAAIIEGLISQKYLARDGRELFVSGKGLRLIEVIREIGADDLASASMTGDWEYKLRQMEQGMLTRPEFMQEIIGFTKKIVDSAKTHAEELKNRKFSDLNATCPVCGAKDLRQTDATYECRGEDCKFKLKKHIAGRELKPEEAAILLAKGFVGPLDGFRSRFNKPFEAALELDEKFKIAFVFEGDSDKDIELKDDMIVARVKRPDGEEAPIYQTEKAFFIPAITTKKEPKGLRIGKEILSRSITIDQVEKIVSVGKTDLIQGFVSNRTKRKFSAYLKWDAEDEKIVFEFEARKKTAKKTSKKSAKKSAKKTAKKED